jgi:carbon storage regulator
MVGENVEIVVISVRGNRVRLGINAPKYIPVHRKEIYEAIERNKADRNSSIERGRIRWNNRRSFYDVDALGRRKKYRKVP